MAKEATETVTERQFPDKSGEGKDVEASAKVSRAAREGGCTAPLPTSWAPRSSLANTSRAIFFRAKSPLPKN
jgi:hypothetical protein